jgi:serine/threonine protein kinase
MLAGYPPFFDDNPFGIYEKILANKPVFPAHFDSSARDLIKKLLSSDRTKRLGNMKGGAEDVKRHKWFKGVDWQALYDRRIPVGFSASLFSLSCSRCRFVLMFPRFGFLFLLCHAIMINRVRSSPLRHMRATHGTLRNTQRRRKRTIDL